MATRIQTSRLQPFRASDGDVAGLLAFARRATPALAPGFAPPADGFFEERDEQPWDYERVTRRQGDTQHGFETTHSVGYEPRGGGHAVDQVVVAAYGLPDGVTLRLECTRSWYDPRFLELQVSGEEPAVAAVLDAFQREFGGRPALLPADVGGEMRSIQSALRAGAWPAVALRSRAVLQICPDEPDALFALGVTEAAQGHLDAGEQHLLAALAQRPDHSDALYNLGRVYLERGDAARAIETFRRSLAVQPGNHAALYQLGRALEVAGQPREALAAYQEAVRTSPNPHGWHYAGLDFTQPAQKAIRRLRNAGFSSLISHFSFLISLLGPP